jgi:uncharacterized protein YbcI
VDGSAQAAADAATDALHGQTAEASGAHGAPPGQRHQQIRGKYMASDEVVPGAPATNGPLAAEISRRMVRLISEYTGRGPTRARTYVHSNLVVCVLADTLTKGERSLAQHGAGASVIDTRRTYQQLMRDDATAMVEELMGRTVIAFFSDHNLDPDMALEGFVLAPDDGADPARSE